jgi:aspartate 1-decarboxylase
LKESLRKDNEEVQDLKAEIVVMNNENKQLKTKTKARISVVTVTKVPFL